MQQRHPSPQTFRPRRIRMWPICTSRPHLQTEYNLFARGGRIHNWEVLKITKEPICKQRFKHHKARVIWFSWGKNRFKGSPWQVRSWLTYRKHDLESLSLRLGLVSDICDSTTVVRREIAKKDVHASCKQSHRTLWPGLTYLAHLTYLATWGFHSRALHTPCPQGQCIHLTTSVKHLPGQWE